MAPVRPWREAKPKFRQSWNALDGVGEAGRPALRRAALKLVCKPSAMTWRSRHARQDAFEVYRFRDSGGRRDRLESSPQRSRSAGWDIVDAWRSFRVWRAI